MISIHAPLTGSDGHCFFVLCEQLYFNPRSPHRERLFHCTTRSLHRYFNPRSPHRERPFLSQEACCRFTISIHAPLTGSDKSNTSIVDTSHNFNPRSPHRERQRGTNGRKPETPFQSTLPSQGATTIQNRPNHLSIISIHAPLTGSDSAVKKSHMVIGHFNPRSPHRERLFSSFLRR